MKRISLLIVICFVVIFSFCLLGSTSVKADEGVLSFGDLAGDVYVVPHVNFAPVIPYGTRYYKPMSTRVVTPCTPGYCPAYYQYGAYQGNIIIYAPVYR